MTVSSLGWWAMLTRFNISVRLVFISLAARLSSLSCCEGLEGDCWFALFSRVEKAELRCFNDVA